MANEVKLRFNEVLLNDADKILYEEVVDNHYQPNANTIAYWEFEDDLLDSSTNDNDLTGSNYSFVDSRISGNKALYFNGSTVDVYTSSSISIPGDEGTISFWVSGITYDKYLYDTSTTGRYVVIPQADLSIWTQIGDNALQTGAATVSNTGWYNVIITWSSTNDANKIYINGSEEATEAHGTVGSKTDTFYLGQRFNKVSQQLGVMDDFIIENRYWDSTDVSNYYTNNLT